MIPFVDGVPKVRGQKTTLIKPVRNLAVSVGEGADAAALGPASQFIRPEGTSRVGFLLSEVDLPRFGV
jgi:hypothetical protein